LTPSPTVHLLLICPGAKKEFDRDKYMDVCLSKSCSTTSEDVTPRFSIIKKEKKRERNSIAPLRPCVIFCSNRSVGRQHNTQYLALMQKDFCGRVFFSATYLIFF